MHAHTVGGTNFRRSPSTLATAGTLDHAASRRYSMSRTVFGFGMPASLATAYHVKPCASRARRICLGIPGGASCRRAPLAGGNSCSQFQGFGLTLVRPVPCYVLLLQSPVVVPYLGCHEVSTLLQKRIVAFDAYCLHPLRDAVSSEIVSQLVGVGYSPIARRPALALLP